MKSREGMQVRNRFQRMTLTFFLLFLLIIINHQKSYAVILDTSNEDFALNFDGVDDYIDCGNDISFAIKGSLTIEAWCKFDRLEYFGVILSRGLMFSNPLEYHKVQYGLSISDMGTINWELCFTNGLGNYDSTVLSYQPKGGFKTDIWYHIAGVWEGTTNNDSIKLYLNGESVVNKTTKYNQLNLPINSTNVNIGRDSYRGSNERPGLHFDGQIDELRVLNRSLLSLEIQEDYVIRKHYPERSETVLWYHLDEGIGLMLNSSTNDTPTGTIYGAIWVSGISDLSQSSLPQILLLVTIFIGVLGGIGSILFVRYKKKKQKMKNDVIDESSESSESSESNGNSLSESTSPQQSTPDPEEVKNYIEKIGKIRATKKEKENLK